MSTTLSTQIFKIPNATIMKGAIISTGLLSVVMIILGGIIVGSANKLVESSQKTNIRRSGTGIIVMAVIILLADILLYLLYRKNF